MNLGNLPAQRTAPRRAHRVNYLAQCSFARLRCPRRNLSTPGDLMNGYFAGQVATAAHLHEAITSDDADDDLIDHADRVLHHHP